MSYRARSRLRIVHGTLVASLVLSGQVASGQSHEWGYDPADGPARWGALNPSFAACADGKHQSPIDLHGAKTADLPPIEFKYQPAPLKVIDNGHTVQMNYAPGSTISVGGQTFELTQFHFHRPSENHLNGRTFPMELHLVHQNSEGKLAVVAVFLKVGSENPAVKSEWAHIPKEKDKEVTVEGVTVDAGQLLPKARGYYTFDGSLTTPPCSEGVVWFVMKEPAEISKAELNVFNHLYSHDARPVQPLNDRNVQASR